MNMTNDVILNTHRGEPFAFINDEEAKQLGIENGDLMRVFNDYGDMRIAAKVTPSCRPGQLIVYNGFEPYMHEQWWSQSDLEAGHIKHLGLVGKYGHLTYRLFSWQPIPADRAVKVDVERVDRA